MYSDSEFQTHDIKVCVGPIVDNELVLCHILSFLTTEEAVWRNLWKWVPTLDLDSIYFPNEEACADFIYLSEFKLTTGNYVSLYEPCLRRVIKNKVQHLQVDNKLGLRNINIPLTTSLCEALVSLKIHCVKLKGFKSLSLPCLKTLYLEDVIFPKLQVMIDSPRPEYLTLIDSEFESFNIIMSMSDSIKVDIDVDFEPENHMTYQKGILSIIFSILFQPLEYDRLIGNS